jgi:hypothetical protein
MKKIVKKFRKRMLAVVLILLCAPAYAGQGKY